MRARALAVTFGALMVLVPRVAKAHFILSQPPSSLSTEDGGKGPPPCGEGIASNVVTKVQGGSPLTIRLLEFVPHPGHYRIALSLNSRAELPPDPDVVVNANGLSVSAAIQNPPKFPILADGLFAHTDASSVRAWQAEVMLPNIDCAKCTLQVIEFMAEHGPNIGGGYFYHHCADLQITAKPNDPRIMEFAGTPTTVRLGQSATLSWTTAEATSVLIDGGVGAQPLSGSVTVAPNATTTYTLTAMGGRTSATGLATINVLTAPTVVVSSFPTAMLQQPGSGGATTRFTLTNAGGSGATVTLSQSQNFFAQTPTSFTLNPGASQAVTITGTAQSNGAREGVSIVSGNGVAAGLQIPIKLLSTAPPAGAVAARPLASRVDVAAPAGASPAGTVIFTNSGEATLTGILTSDQPWLIPQSGMVSIPPVGTSSFSFTIDRSRRRDAVGSTAASLSLAYQSSASPSISRVTIVDTVQPTLTVAAGPPPLSDGEVALFVPGVGHVTGSVGTFISDVSLLGRRGNEAISDVQFFYGGKSTALPSIGGEGIALADVAKNVFDNDAQVGSLQIRSASATKLLVSTNIFNSSNAAGTTGTVIPTFRSDRGVGAGDGLVLTGLRRDATSHTNLFIQEMSGAGSTIQTEFLAADGSSLGTRTDAVGPFALNGGNNVVPAGAVAAILTNTGPGKFLAYATPVDDASGDNWSVVDWSKQFGYSRNEAVIIPVAGVVHGANNTFFRTDVAVTNTGSGTGSGTLRYVSRTGDDVSRQIALGARQSNVIHDVIGTLFGSTADSVGYLLFTPITGTFAITSRTYTTAGGGAATFGTGVPTLAASGALKAGAMQSIGSLEDSAAFRTNFGLMEVSGSSVRVRVTLRVPAIGSASKDYTLNPNQFLLLNGIASEILGAARDTLGDLRGLQADFQVLDGNGAVVLFTASVDNGTGDLILRTE
ncbi:MAG TPA: SCE4755 family polysaccharide monooxygenase-like protein [Thermoanaerobaculia bacterium]